MREIKFRAWEKDTRQMHEVVQIDFKNWIAIPVPEAVNDEGGVNWVLEQRRIQEVELMQYTGLKDKNGKDIYEGDIVTHNIYTLESGKYMPSNPKAVFWDKEKAGFETNEKSSYSAGMFYNTYEIIGNIYENPNLLK